MPTRHSKLDDPKNIALMDQEERKAQEFLRQYLAKIYPDRVFD